MIVPKETRDSLQSKILQAKALGLTDIETTRDALELFVPGILSNYIDMMGIRVHVYGTTDANYKAMERSAVELNNIAE